MLHLLSNNGEIPGYITNSVLNYVYRGLKMAVFNPRGRLTSFGGVLPTLPCSGRILKKRAWRKPPALKNHKLSRSVKIKCRLFFLVDEFKRVYRNLSEPGLSLNCCFCARQASRSLFGGPVKIPETILCSNQFNRLTVICLNLVYPKFVVLRLMKWADPFFSWPVNILRWLIFQRSFDA